MNGPHDLGGQQAFGPVRPELDEPLWHAAWEARALALTVAMGAGGAWNIDLSRSARESLPPAVYLSSSYYEIWMRALAQLLLERGLISPDEFSALGLIGPAPHATPHATPSAHAVSTRVLHAHNVAATLAAGSPTARPAPGPALFSVGQRVQARNQHPPGHTRLPRYVRGHRGTVQAIHGAHVFPDRHVSHPTPPFDQTPEWLYTVVFDGQELWGPQADALVQVSVEAWEPYLEAVA